MASSWSTAREVHKIRRWDMAAIAMSNENFAKLNKILPNSCDQFAYPYSRPIAYSKYQPGKPYRRRSWMPASHEILRQPQPKGIIFIWPQKRHFYYEREYTLLVKILAQVFYWLHAIGLFPCGSGMPIKRPPWCIQPPLPKPENRDYIIEPDWNSVFIV